KAATHDVIKKIGCKKFRILTRDSRIHKADRRLWNIEAETCSSTKSKLCIRHRNQLGHGGQIAEDAIKHHAQFLSIDRANNTHSLMIPRKVFAMEISQIFAADCFYRLNHTLIRPSVRVITIEDLAKFSRCNGRWIALRGINSRNYLLA